MNNKLFVAGFPYALTEQELSDAFAQAGAVVSAKVITDRETGRSRGFGFVEMSTDEEAQAAIVMLDQTQLGGRTLSVTIAEPMKKRDNRNGGYGRPNDRRSDQDEFGSRGY